MSAKDSCAITIGDQLFTTAYLQALDRPDFIDLHQHVFGQTFDEYWYDWKYQQRQSPALGMRNAAGQLIANCAGVPRVLFLQGASYQAIQIGDVMVHPQWRGILSRKSPFYWVSQGFYQTQIGPGAPYQIGFGFPSTRHLRLAQTLGLLSDGGLMWELSWPSNAATLPWHWPLHWQAQELFGNDPRWQEHIQAAWLAMQAHQDQWCWADRSSSELSWRYQEHPSHTYRYLILKRPWSAAPLGIAVWRYGDATQQSVLWLDWIGPPQYLHLAQQMMARLAKECGADHLKAWFSQALCDRLKKTPHCTAQVVAHLGIPCTSAIDLAQAKTMPWWWMAGDTDFL